MESEKTISNQAKRILELEAQNRELMEALEERAARCTQLAHHRHELAGEKMDAFATIRALTAELDVLKANAATMKLQLEQTLTEQYAKQGGMTIEDYKRQADVQRQLSAITGPVGQ